MILSGRADVEVVKKEDWQLVHIVEIIVGLFSSKQRQIKGPYISFPTHPAGLGAYEKGQYSYCRWLHWQKCHVILDTETEDFINEYGGAFLSLDFPLCILTGGWVK
jgi:hypothetical protein